MAETSKLGLPLLAAAQAQKHVTVNAALLRIDALAHPLLEGFGTTTPPANPGEGSCYLVGSGATGAWAGQAGRLALRVNGGWEYALPPDGMQAWDRTAARTVIHRAGVWHGGAQAISVGGAAISASIREIDHSLTPGGTNTTASLFPANALVLAVTARVTTAISGTGVTSLSIGVAADPLRYGSGIGLGLNAWARGVTGSPVAYYADTPLVLTADTGTFGGGVIRLAAHILEFDPPAAV